MEPLTIFVVTWLPGKRSVLITEIGGFPPGTKRKNSPVEIRERADGTQYAMPFWSKKDAEAWIENVLHAAN